MGWASVLLGIVVVFLAGMRWATAWASVLLGIVTVVFTAGMRWATEVEAVVGIWMISLVPAILGFLLGVVALRRPRAKRVERIVALVGIVLNLAPGVMFFVVFRHTR